MNARNKQRQRMVEQHEIRSLSLKSLSNSRAKLKGRANDFSSRIESFREVREGLAKGDTDSDSVEQRLSWLNSQIIGGDVEFETPFGKRRLTYADHTASGRCLHYIENYITKNVLPFYGNSHTSDSYVGYKTTKMVHEATKYVKKCLGGGEDDALIFTGSGTTGAIKRLQEVMGISIPSILRDKVLKYLPNEERWVVFVGPYEHHSNILSWRQSLAQVVEIGLDENGLLDMEALRKELELYRSTNRPLLGSFSACSNVTGIITDTRAIASLLHKYGGFACFDFAASAPYVKIEMKSGEIEGYDAIFLSPHKFLGGPGSPGILLMNKSLYRLGSSPPSTCGGGTVDFVNGFNENDTIYLENIEEREDAGTPSLIQKIKAALAFWIKEYIGYEFINRQEHMYSKQALQRLIPNKYIRVLGNTSVNRQAILSFLIYTTTNESKEIGKPLHGPFVAKLLNDLFGIQARGGCACAGPYGHSLLKVDEKLSLAYRSSIKLGYNGVKPGWTRVSFPYYMFKEEFTFVLEALEFIAIYGQKFLPLYHFNWKSGVWTFKKKTFNEILQEKENWPYFYTKLPKSIKALKESEEYNAKMMCNKYNNYLETAKFIASFLPKFPPSRPIPKEVYPDLVHFRV